MSVRRTTSRRFGPTWLDPFDYFLCPIVWSVRLLALPHRL